MPSREIPADDFAKLQFLTESYSNGFDVEPIKDFLKKLLVGNRIAVHFQGYGTETATMVVTLKNIFWDGEGLPKITCTGLKELRRTLGEGAVFEGNGHFWGSFIIAIALVHPGTPLYCGRDETARHFIATVRRWGLDKKRVGDARFVVRARD